MPSEMEVSPPNKLLTLWHICQHILLYCQRAYEQEVLGFRLWYRMFSFRHYLHININITSSKPSPSTQDCQSSVLDNSQASPLSLVLIISALRIHSHRHRHYTSCMRGDYNSNEDITRIVNAVQFSKHSSKGGGGQTYVRKKHRFRKGILT